MYLNKVVFVSRLLHLAVSSQAIPSAQYLPWASRMPQPA